ncbi:MAG: phosphatase PAP2 family protein [Bacteroidales bacterium]|nr:phosphatase PAP2 family protein [Bacteroidales bacterium]
MRTFQKLVSAILHPLLLPLYGTVLLFSVGMFSELPINYRLYIEGIVLLNMGIVPGFGVWLLKKAGHISDLDVSVRSERVFPYLITLISYSTACYLLLKYQMPWWIVKLFIGSVFATFIAFFISLKWKISAHTLAFGCVVASIFLVCLNEAKNPLLLYTVLFFLAGLQASSRLYLKAHTLGQVCGGFCLGVCSVVGTFFLIP